eukprot:1775821-Pleurochrysis_carterae.AAC.1
MSGLQPNISTDAVLKPPITQNTRVAVGTRRTGRMLEVVSIDRGVENGRISAGWRKLQGASVALSLIPRVMTAISLHQLLPLDPRFDVS